MKANINDIYDIIETILDKDGIIFVNKNGYTSYFVFSINNNIYYFEN